MAGTATAPAKGASDTSKAAAAPAAARPFITGTREVDKNIYDVTKTTVTTTQRLDTYELDTDGFTSALYILVEGTTAGNSATVTFAADGPFNAIDTVQFSDTSNKAILGPMNGHDLYEIIKHGGYCFSDDAKQSAIYSAVTGSGATGGSFTFVLRLPIEIVHRDALGALLNKSASAVYKLDITLAATATIYGTPPTAAPSVRTRIQQFGWMDPNATDIRGNAVSQAPPALNTVQFWDKQTYNPAAGSLNLKLNTFSGLVRNLIFELRDNSQSRQQGDADFPDPFIFQYETSLPVQRIRNIWRHKIGEDFGYTAAVETAGGRDYGVYPLPYNKDFGLKPGAESRFGYLPVSSATSLMAKGSIGGANNHPLNVFVNYVVPANGDPRAITGGK
ncbi:hypothetical protein SAMN05216489_09990 [Streptomyces sp. 3213]|uniref:hypothetical protein n=1 Tax=Streptomyces sp. 3213.3 TaxID=1855348 RepID=UPI00089943DE|nr:hypothetical protein [Streptomyces sp. 3213.3]SEF12930.1 hypothetical protein SAMN05216489_09990 [Streptomyces sp. 3213] [Streptomyces sp. 3213.3]